jgi:hypothetical protein
MVTISDLPESDPSVERVLQTMWLGAVRITRDTVLDQKVIQKQIDMFSTAEVSNTCEAASVAETLRDLKKILSYIK